MVKNHELQTEVRQAVQEYLDRLLKERTLASGKQMNVTSHDALVAARSAGVLASRQEARQVVEDNTPHHLRLVRSTTPSDTGRDSVFDISPGRDSVLEIFQQPDIRVQEVRGESRASVNVADNSQLLRPNSVPLVAEEGTNRCPSRALSVKSAKLRTPSPAPPKKKQYHWLVWRTSPTPEPQQKPGRSPTPAANPVRASCPTPVKPRTPQPWRTPTPAKYQKPDSPVPVPEPLAGHGPRHPTPSEFDPDHRDIMASPQVQPSKTYMPAFQAWVSGADDYERDVAFNMLQAMQGGARASARSRASQAADRHIHRTRALQATSPGPGTGRPSTAGVRTMGLTAGGIQATLVHRQHSPHPAATYRSSGPAKPQLRRDHQSSFFMLMMDQMTERQTRRMRAGHTATSSPSIQSGSQNTAQ